MKSCTLTRGGRPAAIRAAWAGPRKPAALSLAAGLTLAAGLALAAGLVSAVGCASPWFGEKAAAKRKPSDRMELDDKARFVEDVARPWGLHALKVEGVALVTQLQGTGSQPPPSPQTNLLVQEMLTHNVPKPSEILKSTNNSLVLVRAFLPPGVQKGEPVDIEVMTPSRSETTSLRDGWLMPARLRPIAIVSNDLHTGHVSALATGPVLVDAIRLGGGEPARETRGWVLGGGVSQVDRALGLQIDDSSSLAASAIAAAAINNRFHTFGPSGVKEGVATAKSPKFIDLRVHHRYRRNIGRYLRVVLALPLKETPAERMERIQSLERQLLEPTSAFTAATRLEALGKDALPALKAGLAAEDFEARFYAAEALAYLDQVEAVGPLAEAARNHPEFRWHALAALAAMDQLEASQALSDLLHVPSVETRYGAFRALQARNSYITKGERLGARQEVSLHVIETSGEPLVHCSLGRRPEIVVFGHDARIAPPTSLILRNGMLLTATGPESVKISWFAPGREDARRESTNRVVDVARALFEMGAGYGDLLQLLQTARERDLLACRLETDALPTPDRLYAHRDQNQPAAATARAPRGPLPDLFQVFRENEAASDTESASATAADLEEVDDVLRLKPAEEQTFFGRMTAWFGGDDAPKRR